MIDKKGHIRDKLVSSEFSLLVEALIRGLNFTVALLKKAKKEGKLN